MSAPQKAENHGRFARSGALAGAACGLCTGWSYALLVEKPAPGSWLRYNLLYVAMFVLLVGISVLLDSTE